MDNRLIIFLLARAEKMISDFNTLTCHWNLFSSKLIVSQTCTLNVLHFNNLDIFGPRIVRLF